MMIASSNELDMLTNEQPNFIVHKLFMWFKSENFDQEDQGYSSRSAVIDDNQIKVLLKNNLPHITL